MVVKIESLDVELPRLATATSTAAGLDKPDTESAAQCASTRRRTAKNNDGDSQDTVSLNKEAALKLKSLENPKVKLKKDPYADAPLDPTMILALLDSIPVYEVKMDKAESEVGVSRAYISATFGGNPQDTFPHISAEKLAKHGIDNFMFINKEFNPNAPTMPGRGGLFYDVGEDGNYDDEDEDSSKKKVDIQKWPWAETQRLFTRIQSNDWLYMGEYRMSYGKKFTKDQWSRQSKKVKNTWASKIAERRWGLSYRVRIALRAQLGRSPTRAELRDELVRAQGANDEFKHVTVDQIAKAFENGEEWVLIWKMQCVGHDADFQRRIVKESQNWVPPPPNVKKSVSASSKKRVGKAKDTTTADATPKKRTGRKRKRSQDDDLDPDSASEDEGVAPVYKHRGTRSRPIAI